MGGTANAAATHLRWGATRMSRGQRQADASKPVLYVVGQPDSKGRRASGSPKPDKQRTPQTASPVRIFPLRLTRVERRRLQRSAETELTAADRRLDAAARRPESRQLKSDAENATERLAKAAFDAV